MKRGGRDINSGLYMLELANTNNIMTETKSPDRLIANNVYEYKYKVNLVKYLN